MEPRNILDHFAELNDPREDNIRHLLIDIIAIVICASICGAETCAKSGLKQPAISEIKSHRSGPKQPPISVESSHF